MPCVQVNLFATLRQYVGGAPSVDLEIVSGTTIRQVLEELGVPVEQTQIIFRDSRAAELDDPLQGGEQLGIFPALGGG